jgi:hypothetical protein
VKKFDEEINDEIIGSVERQFAKKRLNVSTNAASFIFVVKRPFKKDDV